MNEFHFVDELTKEPVLDRGLRNQRALEMDIKQNISQPVNQATITRNLLSLLQSNRIQDIVIHSYAMQSSMF